MLKIFGKIYFIIRDNYRRLKVDFSVYRGKIKLLRIVGALLAGVAAAGFVGGVLNLLIRLEVIPLDKIYGFVIGFGAGALVFISAYALLRMPSKKLARKLDNDFSLSERVQTTLEYDGREEAIYELQREDTKRVLADIDPKKLGLRGFSIYILCAVLGASMLICSFFFKKPDPIEEKPVDPPFALTEIQEAALVELIEYVNASGMDTPYRDDVASALSLLLSELKAADVMSERDSSLASALQKIYKSTDDSSFTLELAEELYGRDNESMKALAKALNYYSYTAGEEWESFADELALMRIAFIHPDVLSGSPDFEKMSEQTKALIASAASEAAVAMTRSGIPSGDPLAVILSTLFEKDASSFAALASSDLGYEALQESLDLAFASIDTELFDELLNNKTNTDTGEYAMKRLAAIFSYPCPSFERPRLRDQSAGGAAGGSDSESGGGQGAIGSGTVFGSSDLVLDPNTDEYVEYGTIISRYYEIVFGKLESDAYTEEEKAAMEKYFDILYGTAKDEKGA